MEIKPDPAPRNHTGYDRLRVSFVAANLPLPVIRSQALRYCSALDGQLGGRIRAEKHLLPRNYFNNAGESDIGKLMEGVDIVIFVKPSLFHGFDAVSPAVCQVAHKRGVIVVSHPCDTPDSADTQDKFSFLHADYLLALSTRQARDYRQQRNPEEVFGIGYASRIEGELLIEPPRETVKRVLWENPVHYNPDLKGKSDFSAHHELEEKITALCWQHGAELQVISAWFPPYPYLRWLGAVREADIAIECKALEHRHTRSQLHNSGAKVLNYMSAGLPTVCDSLPAYRELDEEGGGCLLFADTLDEWQHQLTRLFTEPELRTQMSQRSQDVAHKHTIDAIVRRLVAALGEMAARRGHR